MYRKKIEIVESKQQGVVKVVKVTSKALETIFEDGATARCSKNDTYDFEVGALIALMRFCGIEKVEKALSEVFPNDFKSKSPNRDKLWTKYLSNDIVCVKVRRESINDFLKEAEVNSVLWSSGPKPTENTYNKQHWDYWRKHECIYFVINNKTMSFSAYDRRRDVTFDYIPPLNAKLFKRNKYAIRVKGEDFGEFRKWCKLNGMENFFIYAEPENGFIYHKETGHVLTNNLGTGYPSTPIIYNWEDMIK